jgi:TP901 family phage tail tape measure protein
VADLDISARLLLENAKDLQRQLEEAGQASGSVFGQAINNQAQKGLDDLVARAERAAKQVGLAFNRTTLQFESPKGEIIPEATLKKLGRLNAELGASQRELKAFAAEAERTGQQAADGFDLMDAAVTGVAFSIANTLTTSVLQAGGQVAGVLKGLVGGFADLDAEIRKAAAAGGEQGGYEKLSRAVDRVGVEAAGTQIEVAQLLTELVRGGMTVDQATQSLGAIVRGAEATGTAYAQMGDVVGASLKGFGLEAKDAQRVVDALTQGANSSATSVSGLGMAFKYAAPVAKILGVSVEELAVAAGLLTNTGIDASEAGVTLRNGLSKLASAAPQTGGGMKQLTGQAAAAAKVMKTLGLDIYEADGTLKPMEQTLLTLKGAFDKLGPSARVRLAADLFGGEDDGTKWLSLLGQSETEIKKMSAAMANTKGAADTAREAMSGLKQKIEELKGGLDTLGKTFGAAIAPAMIVVVEAAKAVVGAISDLPTPVKQVGATLILLVGGLVAARVSLALFQAALATTQVQSAIQGLLSLGAVLRGKLAADMAFASAAWTRMIAAMVAANTTQISFGAVAAAIRDNVVKAALSGALAMVKLGEAIASGALLTSLKAFAAGAWAAVAPLLPFVAAAAAVAGAIVVWNNVLSGANDISKDFAETQKTVADEVGKLNETLGENAVQVKESRGAIDELFRSAGEGYSLIRLGQEVERLQGTFGIAQEGAMAFYRELQRSGVISDEQKTKAKQLADQLTRLAEAGRNQAAQLRASAGEEELKGNTGLAENMRSRANALDAEARATANLAAGIRAKAGVTEADTKATQANNAAQETAEDIERRRLALVKLRRTQGEAEISQRQALGSLTREEAEEERRQLAITEARLEREAQIQRLKGLTGDQAVAAQQQIAELDREIADLQVQGAEAAVQRWQRVYDLAVQRLELESTAIGLQKQGAEQVAARLRGQQQILEAQLGLQQAQAALVQSRFAVQKARNDRAVTSAEEQLQLAIERGASESEIELRTRRVVELRRRAVQIEQNAIEAGIMATAQRFQIEQRLLAAKQAQQAIEARSAQLAAAQNTIQQEQRLLEIRKQLADPNITAGQRAILQEQLGLQYQAVGLAQQQQRNEIGRLDVMKQVFGLERETLSAQQQTTANTARAEAIAKGYEDRLAGSLNQLDRAASSSSGMSDALKQVFRDATSVESSVKGLSNVLDQAKVTTDSTANAAQSLASGYANANTNAQALLGTLTKIAATPQARWAGGPVEPGTSYRVNELGQESLLSASGRLSLIDRARNAMWRPPSRGVVLPAGMTEQLAMAGAFGGSGGRAGRSGSRGGGAVLQQVARSGDGMRGLTAAVARQGALLGKLGAAIDRLAARDWRVTIHTPGNAGLIRSLQGFS